VGIRGQATEFVTAESLIAKGSDISEGLDFVMSHDAELLTRLEDA
jgi:hypothetical protein